MKKSFDKKTIGALVARKLRECNSTTSSSLSSERLKVLRYYNGELPEPPKAGRSRYVSRDVYDGVESQKAQLVETFSGGRDIVRFTPLGPEDVRPARQATAFCSFWFWDRNPGEQIILNAAHDGLMARVGIVKVYWLADEEEVEEEFGSISSIDLEAMNADPDVLESATAIDPATGMVLGGTLTRRINNGRIVVENVAPEEFFIDNAARDLTGFHGHKTPLSAAEIEQRWKGSSKLLKNISPDAHGTDIDDMETTARISQIDSGYSANLSSEVRPEDRKYWVYECYFTTTSPDTNREVLLKVINVGGEHGVTIAMEEVDRTPFKAFVPLPISHSFYGNNFARLLVQTQNSRTALLRAVLDHTAITTNPRFLVQAGALSNARELLDNRLGGIVNVDRPDAVMPLPQAPLNPFVFQTQDLMRVAAEQSTGISALSMGNDKAVISNQNSAALVAQQVDLAQVRQRLPARALASFLRDIFLEIHTLAVEHCDRTEWIDVAGEWQEIDPRQWKERKAATVTMHLSPGDREAAAMKKIAFFTQARQDPMINEMITVENAYQFAVDAAEGADIKDVASYVTNPKNIPPKQPDPMMIKKMELEERSIALQENAVQAQQAKVDAEFEAKMARLELDKVKMELDQAIRERDAARKDADVMNRIDIGQREIAAAEAAPVMDPAKPIISP